jgi:hypothetical protein
MVACRSRSHRGTLPSRFRPTRDVRRYDGVVIAFAVPIGVSADCTRHADSESTDHTVGCVAGSPQRDGDGIRIAESTIALGSQPRDSDVTSCSVGEVELDGCADCRSTVALVVAPSRLLAIEARRVSPSYGPPSCVSGQHSGHAARDSTQHTESPSTHAYEIAWMRTYLRAAACGVTSRSALAPKKFFRTLVG